MSSNSGMEGIGNVGTPRAFILCPHCEAPAIIRSSTRVSPAIKDIRLKCSNEDCGFSWVAQIAPVHTICPSQIPNPDVHIKPCPAEYQRQHFRKADSGDPPDPDQLMMFPDIAA